MAATEMSLPKLDMKKARNSTPEDRENQRKLMKVAPGKKIAMLQASKKQKGTEEDTSPNEGE